MAYDEKLANRISKILNTAKGISRKKMFGGLCFLHNGNMLCGIDKHRNLMVRVGPEYYQKALKLKHAREMDFTGKPLTGMVYVAPEGIKTRTQLVQWIERGLSFTRSLPEK